MTATSGSMEPNIRIKDVLAVDKNYYSSKKVARFDIVIVKLHPATHPDFTIVARVIALGSETIRIRNNKVSINGALLKEPFETRPCEENEDGEFFPCANFGPLKAPHDEFFLLADNRRESQDGRTWQPPTIRRDQVIGKVIDIKRNRQNIGARLLFPTHRSTGCLSALEFAITDRL
jgi:signal peptidase I